MFGTAIGIEGTNPSYVSTKTRKSVSHTPPKWEKEIEGDTVIIL